MCLFAKLLEGCYNANVLKSPCEGLLAICFL
jgi:hypothetical protein